MPDGKQKFEPEPSNFATAAANWDVANYGSWLRAGLDSWFHPRSTPGRRAVAFRPLMLNPDRDPVAQVLDAAETIPAGVERLRDANSEALATWTPQSAQAGQMLNCYLRIAQKLPSPAQVPALRRLLLEGYLDGLPQRELLALQAIETAFELVVLNEGEKLLRDLRYSRSWRPSYAAIWLEGMVEAKKIDWLKGLQELSGDFQRIDPGADKLRPMLRRLVKRGGDAQLVAERFHWFDLNDRWLTRALFVGKSPVIGLDTIRDPINKNEPTLSLRTESDAAMLSYDPKYRGYKDVLYRIYSRLDFSPESGVILRPQEDLDEPSRQAEQELAKKVKSYMLGSPMPSAAYH